MVCFAAWLIATETLIFDQVSLTPRSNCSTKRRGRFGGQSLSLLANGRWSPQATQKWKGYDSNKGFCTMAVWLETLSGCGQWKLRLALPRRSLEYFPGVSF